MEALYDRYDAMLILVLVTELGPKLMVNTSVLSLLCEYIRSRVCIQYSTSEIITFFTLCTDNIISQLNDNNFLWYTSSMMNAFKWCIEWWICFRVAIGVCMPLIRSSENDNTTTGVKRALEERHTIWREAEDKWFWYPILYRNK